MKKTIKLSRIHCVGCAENLEAKILEVDGVVWAEVDFSNRTVNLNVLNKEVVNEVVKTITKFDSSIKIVDTSDEDKELKKEKTKNIIDIIRMGLTVLFLSLAIFLPKSVYWLKILFYSFAYLIVGYEIIWIALRNIIRGKVLDENFLMTIATIGAFILSKFSPSTL